ncbi:unnamed protein product [Meloidogyne enterolobii]|uniref:Uncharacterized protein n=1 Tax=Meloidogyne enterolobii TaxID=390850 RepID=A0ACB0XQ88_MELEN
MPNSTFFLYFLIFIWQLLLILFLNLFEVNCSFFVVKAKIYCFSPQFLPSILPSFQFSTH